MMPRVPTKASSQLDGYGSVLGELVALIESARRAAARSVNAVMTATYFLVGRAIVEHEQKGGARAAYGEQLLDRLVDDLSARFGRRFSRANVASMRLFYLTYRDDIVQTLSGQSGRSKKVQTASGESELARLATRFPLPWSHYVLLLGARSPEARAFYEAEALHGGWTVRQLRRQIGTQFYERTALSWNKTAMFEKGARKHRPHGEGRTRSTRVLPRRALGRRRAVLHPEANRAASQAPGPAVDPAPRLWILTAGRPAKALDELGFVHDATWPWGVHRCAPGFLVKLIVVSDLPVTRDTLLLRVLGAGPVLKAAIAELAALPTDAPERSVVLPIVLRLWGERDGTDQSAEDEDFYMSTEAIVQQWERDLLEKGALKGIRDTLMRQLRTRFGALDAASESRVAEATVDELNRWTERVIAAERIDDVFTE